MSWEPAKWYRIGNRSKYHMVHRLEPDITWCGYPTHWEPYEQQTATKGKICNDCRKKDEEHVAEKAAMKVLQLRAGKSGW